MKKVVSYVMRKKDNKYVITRYIFSNNSLESKFWVNTYSDIQDAKDYFDIIRENVKFHNHKLNCDCICKNFWEINYDC